MITAAHHWRPYVIEKICDEDYSHCDVRMDYAPGQHAGLAGPGSYWYQSTFPRTAIITAITGCRGMWRGALTITAPMIRTPTPSSGSGYHRYRCNSPY